MREGSRWPISQSTLTCNSGPVWWSAAAPWRSEKLPPCSKPEQTLRSSVRISLIISPAGGSRARFDLHARRYRAGDTVGYRIVFAATDDADLNDVVFRECRNSGVWVNAADDPGRCDFILPSVLRRGDLAIAISTGGDSPALSRTIREELEFYFTGEYDSLVKLASEVRSELRAKGLTVPFENWQRALSGDVRQLLMRGDLAGRARFFSRTWKHRCKGG